MKSVKHVIEGLTKLMNILMEYISGLVTSVRGSFDHPAFKKVRVDDFRISHGSVI